MAGRDVSVQVIEEIARAYHLPLAELEELRQAILRRAGTPQPESKELGEARAVRSTELMVVTKDDPFKLVPYGTFGCPHVLKRKTKNGNKGDTCGAFVLPGYYVCPAHFKQANARPNGKIVDTTTGIITNMSSKDGISIVKTDNKRTGEKTITIEL